MSTYQIFYNRFERDFFGCLTTGILVQSIVGGIAAMYILMHGTSAGRMVQLFFVVLFCMLYNGAVYSQQKPKVIFNALLLSLAANSLFIIANLIW